MRTARNAAGTPALTSWGFWLYNKNKMSEQFKVRDIRIKEKFQVDDAYLNGFARLCGINATGVYLSLCRHADRDQECFPSKDLISRELAISVRSVYNALKVLVAHNVISIQQQGRKSDGHFRNHTYLLLDKSVWKKTPSAYGADGKKRHSPSANNDTNGRHVVPKKETHMKETHKKEVFNKLDKESLYKKMQWR